MFRIALDKRREMPDASPLCFGTRRMHIRRGQIRAGRCNAALREQQRDDPFAASSIKNRRALWHEMKQGVVLRAVRMATQRLRLMEPFFENLVRV